MPLKNGCNPIPLCSSAPSIKPKQPNITTSYPNSSILAISFIKKLLKNIPKLGTSPSLNMKIYKIAQSINNQFTWSDEIWNLIFKSMKSQGFAFSSKEDTKNSFERLCKRTNDNQFYTNTQIFPEWNLAIQKAFDSMKKRQQTLTNSIIII